MPRLKKAFEHARRQATQLGRGCVGTEHLLLGLIEVDGLAGHILEQLGAGPERVREQLAAMLGVDAPELASRLRTRRRRLRRI
jgi:ATP-dependent Clp protease ATP-binding subunit ClpA